MNNLKLQNLFKTTLITLVIMFNSFLLYTQDKKTYIPVNSKNGNEIVISKSSLKKNEASFFSYKIDNKAVKFFAIIDNNNLVHVAFDACDVCYQAKRGYTVINNLTVCNNCGNKYSLSAIGKDNIRGGCWPSYLVLKEDESDIKINISDLKVKSFMF